MPCGKRSVKGQSRRWDAPVVQPVRATPNAGFLGPSSSWQNAVPLTGSSEERDFLPDIDSQRNTESQGDVEQSGDIHYSSQGGRRGVDSVSGTQGELDKVNSQPSLEHGEPCEEGHGKPDQKEEKGSNKLAGGCGNVSLDRGWKTLTQRLRDESLSIRVGASPGSPLPRTRRHCGWLVGKRCELNWMLVVRT